MTHWSQTSARLRAPNLWARVFCALAVFGFNRPQCQGLNLCFWEQRFHSEKSMKWVLVHTELFTSLKHVTMPLVIWQVINKDKLGYSNGCSLPLEINIQDKVSFSPANPIHLHLSRLIQLQPSPPDQSFSDHVCWFWRLPSGNSPHPFLPQPNCTNSADFSLTS